MRNLIKALAFAVMELIKMVGLCFLIFCLFNTWACGMGKKAQWFDIYTVVITCVFFIAVGIWYEYNRLKERE